MCILKTFLVVNRYLLLRITFLKICRLKVLNSLHSWPTYSAWQIQRLLILHYNTQSRPSVPAAVPASPLVLKRENTFILYFKRGDVRRSGTGVHACNYSFKNFHPEAEQILIFQIRMFLFVSV